MSAIDYRHYGPWAVIAGGSEGVGASFARKLAGQGINLVLLARKMQPLEDLAAAIRQSTKVEVRVRSVDLASDSFFPVVEECTRDIEVGLLICNAGAVHGMHPFLDSPVAKATQLIGLNVVGPTRLVHHFASGMRRRGRGGIILVGSGAGMSGAANIVAYAAAKAFLHTLAEGLWVELKPFHVHVLGLVLGATRTPSMIRAGLNLDHPDFKAAEPDAVAQEGLDHLATGPIWVVKDMQDYLQKIRSLPRAEAVMLMSGATQDIQPQ